MTILEQFAAEVGSTGYVTCVGGRTQWKLGGLADPSAREVFAPVGVVDVVPEEMIVRVRAGTPLVELHQALAEVKQRVPLPNPALVSAPGMDRAAELPLDRAASTVGGTLSIAHGGWRQIRLGPPRDCVMEVTYVTAAGELSKSGGPVVKNVSGFDLCRLLVGAHGTLGFMAEFVLRASPIPEASQWLSCPLAEDQPNLANVVQDTIHAPGSILCTNSHIYVLLEGHPADVASDQELLFSLGLVATTEPPTLGANRWSVRRGRELMEGRASGLEFVALAGTGIVTADSTETPDPAPLDPVAAELNRHIKERFDPSGRLNPGRDPLSGFATNDAPQGTQNS